MKTSYRVPTVVHSIMQFKQLRASSLQRCLSIGQKLCMMCALQCNNSVTLAVCQT